MINREALVRKYNPILLSQRTHSPLTVGNGDFAFTADVTGLQTFYEAYEHDCPVLTMSNWGWHTAPFEDGRYYSLDDFNYKMTEYYYEKRIVKYPVKETKENSALYNYLRQNPHRFNLARIGLCLNGRHIEESDVSDIRQELDMYTGILTSRFTLKGEHVCVTTIVGNADTIAVKVESALAGEGLAVFMEFPYASPVKTGSDFAATDKHFTRFHDDGIIERQLDKDKYYCLVSGNVTVTKTGMHKFLIEDPGLTFTVSLAEKREKLSAVSFKQVKEESEFRFYSFWNKGAIIDVTSSEDRRADELERRIITSMYLSAVQDSGVLPPQETGLTCNSWYGKFHLEMHPVHEAYLAIYGRGAMLEKSLKWYVKSLPCAVRNAGRNGFKGARWSKMTGPACQDSPSVIAPLLVWQQPHIIYMLTLLYMSRYNDARVEVPTEPEEEFLKKYADVVRETALFMADFCVYDEKQDCYELKPPLYSVQEKGNPEEIKNPPFETAYFAFGLQAAYEWLKKLGEEHAEWLKIADRIKKPYVNAGLLQAYEGCEDTYTKLNIDHPSMVFAPGFIGAEADEMVLEASLDKVMKNWNFESLWGWDFAFLALTYAKLGHMEKAFDILLMDTAKNTYVESGNNAQAEREDLPLYLPGNGSLLLAMAALKSCKGWYVQTEGLMNYPF
ncbi:MAG: glycoside hydrolase family 65 [Lachnospiraceae bacterium]|nr:glycoside hydrolase family 65 [Lachnospiraceae bacterium]